MVTDSEIQVFVDGVKHYFDTVSDSQAVIGTPYLVDSVEVPESDYVGVINISGVRNGSVCFSAARAMLRHLLISLGETSIKSDLVFDVVGEVANTISGNVREAFGSKFIISVPKIKEKSSGFSDISNNEKALSVPFRWKTYTGHLVVCLH